MERDTLKDFAAAYCLGALDEQDKRRFEELLEKGDPEALQALKEMGEVARWLPFAADPVIPPPSVKEKIMAEIETEGASLTDKSSIAPGVSDAVIEPLKAALRRWKRIAIGVSFAIVILLLGAGGYIFSLHSDLNSLRSKVSLSSQVIENLQIELRLKQRILKIVQAPGSKIVFLNGLEIAPEASARIIFEPQTQRGILYAANLSLPPVDKDYQLWMLRGNQPIDAGLLKADEEGNLYAEFETISPDELTAFAITLEPKGGVGQPTLEAMYLLGTVN